MNRFRVCQLLVVTSTLVALVITSCHSVNPDKDVAEDTDAEQDEYYYDDDVKSPSGIL